MRIQLFIKPILIPTIVCMATGDSDTNFREISSKSIIENMRGWTLGWTSNWVRLFSVKRCSEA